MAHLETEVSCRCNCLVGLRAPVCTRVGREAGVASFLKLCCWKAELITWEIWKYKDGIDNILGGDGTDDSCSWAASQNWCEYLKKLNVSLLFIFGCSAQQLDWCGISVPTDWTRAAAVKVPSPNHYITRQLPKIDVNIGCGHIGKHPLGAWHT